jgi:hypothetical protein
MNKSTKIFLILAIFSFLLTPSLFGQDISSWWKNVQNLHGTRVLLKAEGWNFWYKNDSYIYSDVIGSLIPSTKEGKKLYDYPILGVGVRLPALPAWKIIIVNGVVSTNKIAIGPGISIPIPINNCNIAPWASVCVSWTNGFEMVPSFQGGIDLALIKNRLVLGLEVGVSGDYLYNNSDGWASIGYGLSIGYLLRKLNNDHEYPEITP